MRVAGFPQVPSEYQPYLLASPVEATITMIGTPVTHAGSCDLKCKDTPVVLDAGATKALRVGMELIVTDPSNVAESVRITKVEPDHSEGMMTQIGEETRGPKPGWRLSTRLPLLTAAPPVADTATRSSL